MRFKDVHGIELDLVLILLGQLVQGGNLPPEGRSGIAPEDENDRLVRPKRCQLDRFFRLKRFDCEVGSCVANVHSSRARPCPHRLKGKQEVGRHGHPRHYLPERLRWLVHRPIHIRDKTKPQHNYGASNPAKSPLCGRLHCAVTHFVTASISR